MKLYIQPFPFLWITETSNQIIIISPLNGRAVGVNKNLNDYKLYTKKLRHLINL